MMALNTSFDSEGNSSFMTSHNFGIVFAAVISACALTGCEQSESNGRYVVSSASTVEYFGQQNPRPITILVDTQTGRTWMLARPVSSDVTSWFMMDDPAGAK